MEPLNIIIQVNCATIHKCVKSHDGICCTNENNEVICIHYKQKHETGSSICPRRMLMLSFVKGLNLQPFVRQLIVQFIIPVI